MLRAAFVLFVMVSLGGDDVGKHGSPASRQFHECPGDGKLPSIWQPWKLPGMPVVKADDTSVNSNGGNGEDMPSEEEMKGIDTVVRETGIMKMLKEQSEQHQQDLKELRQTVSEELTRLHTHFEGVVSSMEQKELLLKNHIDALEKKLHDRLANENFKVTGEGKAVDGGESGSSGATDRGSKLPPESTSHFWPFLFLFLLICGCGIYGKQQITKLQSENDYWGQMRRASSGSFDAMARKRSF